MINYLENDDLGATNTLMMNSIECHSRRRGSDVQNGNRTLEFVMSCLMKQVTDGHDANRLAGEIHSQAGSAAGKHTRHGV